MDKGQTLVFIVNYELEALNDVAIYLRENYIIYAINLLKKFMRIIDDIYYDGFCLLEYKSTLRNYTKVHRSYYNAILPILRYNHHVDIIEQPNYDVEKIVIEMLKMINSVCDIACTVVPYVGDAFRRSVANLHDDISKLEYIMTPKVKHYLTTGSVDDLTLYWDTDFDSDSI